MPRGNARLISVNVAMVGSVSGPSAEDERCRRNLVPGRALRRDARERPDELAGIGTGFADSGASDEGDSK